ncbi:MAG: thioesterase family protein [Geovibrio sp.]|nr:thioesterase family protein [Geovibrio sp.]
MTALEKVRWEIQAVITNGDGKTVFTAVQSGAFVDLRNGRLSPVPPVLAKLWAAYQAEKL